MFNRSITWIALVLWCFTSSLWAQHLPTLVPPSTATHTAVQHGDWFDTTTWDTGTVPGDAAIVYIPTGVAVTYEGGAMAHIFAIRVDGTFTCTQRNAANTTQLMFDTFIGIHGSVVQFHAQGATDGDIEVSISPFPIEAHKNGTSGFAQSWNAAALAHFSDGAPVDSVIRVVNGDRRYNTYAQALAGNTMVAEISRTPYNDSTGVTGRYGWDSTQLSLGLVTMGELEILGQPKLTKSKLAMDAARGDAQVELAEIPSGWLVGDTILITRGGNIDTSNNGEDVAIIAAINGTTISLNSTLRKNHEGRPADNLQCYVGNLNRNITFTSTQSDHINQRGHLMAMHSNDNVQIRNAAFRKMGRTDKGRLLDDLIWDRWLEPKVFKSKISPLGQEICEMRRNPKADITNSRGRYSIHLHKNGASINDNMIFVTGNVVWDNPGWGITHHDAYATVSDNVVYQVTGSGIVSESGSELGFWDNNLVVDINKGQSTSPYDGVVFHDDYLFSGQGLGMKGRGVICRNNVIADANQGIGIMNMNPSISNQDRVDPLALAAFRTGFNFDQFPLDHNDYSIEENGVMPVEVSLILENTTLIECTTGLRSIERDMGVNHESRSIFDGFYVWGSKTGLSITYQADYSFRDVFVSGNGATGSIGAFLWKHSHNHIFEDIKFADLDYAVTVSKLVESGDGELKTRNNGVTPWIFVDLETENVGTFYEITKEDPNTATVYTEHSDNPIHLNGSELINRPVTFTILDSTELEVDYAAGDFRFEIDGIITDDLGTYKMGIKQAEAQGTLRLDYPERLYEFASTAKFEEYLTNKGVYQAADGSLYFILYEWLPNRRTHQYTQLPVRVKINNAPNTGIFANPQTENSSALAPQSHLISRQATASQSSTEVGVSYDGEPIDVSAWKAIDGNNNGRINCQIFQRGLVPLGSFSQTEVELEPWYELDLGSIAEVDYIDVWNTVELNGGDIELPSTHLQDFYVLLSDEPFGATGLAAARALADFEYHIPAGTPKRKYSFNNLAAAGRYVRIQAVGTNTMKLAELEVVGKQAARLQIPTKMILSGAYDEMAGLMRDELRLNNWLPPASPYPISTKTIEDPATVLSVTGADAIADWVIVELRDTTDASQIITQEAFLLQRDGDIVDIDGVSFPSFPAAEAPIGSYYVAVQHRNHLGIMSASPIDFTNGIVAPLLNFSTGTAYGTNAQYELPDGTFGLWGGDASNNEQVQNTDIENYWKPTVGQSGYQSADFNLNGQVQNTDLEQVWRGSVGLGTQIPQ